MKKLPFGDPKSRARSERGVGMIEYVVVSGVVMLILLTPFGEDRRNVLQRLTHAMQREHSGYMYAASLPVLPDAQGSYSTGAGPERSGDGPSSGSGNGSDSGGNGGGNTGGGSPGGGAGGDDPFDPDDSAGDGGGGSGSGDSAGDPPGEDGSAGGDDGPGNGAPQMCSAPGAAEDDPFGTGASTGGGFPMGASQPTGLAMTHVGNPIQVVTGNKYQHEVDIKLPGGFGFARHYNSQSRYRGALGRNWRHGYETTLKDRGKQRTLWQADGRRIDFSLTHRDRYGVRHYRAAQHSDGTLTSSDFHRWSWPDGRSLTFTKAGRLHSLADAAGGITRFSYSVQGQLDSITDSDARHLRLAYDEQGRLASVTDPAGQAVHYRYDGQGRLSRASYPDQTSRHYHYEDTRHPYHLTGISLEEESGVTRVATWTYDDQGRALSSTHPDGSATVQLAYAKGATQVTDSTGRTSVYETAKVQDIPHVTAIRGPGCGGCAAGEVAYVYNKDFQIERVERNDGATLVYRYDGQKRLERITYQRSQADRPLVLVRFGYLGDSNQVTEMATPSIKAGAERVVSVRYNGEAQPIEVTEAGFAPQPDGSHKAISRSERFRYDEQGRLFETSGYRTDIAAPTRVDWKSEAHESRISFPDGGELAVLALDANRRPTRIQADGQAPIDLRYDGRGRLAAASRGADEVRFQYDRAGRMSRASNNKPASVGAGHARDLHPPQIARATRTDWDKLGNRTAVTDGKGNPTHYGVDDFGRQVFIQSPDTGLTLFEYDAADNLRRKIVAGGSAAEFDYDAGDRLVSARVGSDETRFKWREGAVERVASILSPQSFELYDYDESGRITSHLRKIGERSYRTAYRYDEDGRLHQQTLPDGRRLRYRYHKDGAHAGQLEAILQVRRLKPDVPLITGLNDEERDSQFSDWIAANDLVTGIHRENNRLARLTIGGLHDFAYHYSLGGHIAGIDDSDQAVARYRFDEAGRLDFALTPEALYGYRYDANGNRSRLVVNGRHTSYDYARDSNRLLGIDAQPASWHPPLAPAPESVFFDPVALKPAAQAAARHNGAGALEQLGNLRFSYNANGQLEEVWSGGAKLASYRYNSRAQRIEKLRHAFPPPLVGGDKGEGAAPEITHYIYEGDQLVAEATAAGEIQAQYLYLGHHPVALLTAEQTFAIHTNHLGAPIAVTDPTRRLVWQARYAPFGRAEVNEDPDGDGERLTLNLRLPGQYEDTETGLHYNHHRYYDPDLGRYLSSDPLGLAGGLNTYTYAANDPVNYVDPTGLLLFAFDGTGNTDDASVYDGNTTKFSNVYKFRESYLGDSGELGVPQHGKESDQHYYYVTGPGTEDRRTGIGNRWENDTKDAATGASMIDRIKALADDFFDYVKWMNFNTPISPGLNIDIVGFSRGAAAARVFANLLDAFLSGADYFTLDHHSGERYEFRNNFDAEFARAYIDSACSRFALRFLGLWDSVPHYGLEGDDLQELQLAIPDHVEYVAHAVSADENRADFDAVSIHRNEGISNSKTRLELGFIGAHADVGGGYPEGDLSDVAFMWMVKRAAETGVTVDSGRIERTKWDTVTEPVVHDSLGVDPFYFSGRQFKYLGGDQILQRSWSGYGMNFAASQQNFYDESYMYCGPKPCVPAKGADKDGDKTKVGRVRVYGEETYQEWLARNYDLTIQINHNGLD